MDHLFLLSRQQPVTCNQQPVPSQTFNFCINSPRDLLLLLRQPTQNSKLITYCYLTSQSFASSKSLKGVIPIFENKLIPFSKISFAPEIPTTASFFI